MITLKVAVAGYGQSGQKITSCETTFGAVSKEIYKMFVPQDRSFMEFRYAYNAPVSSLVSI